MKDMSDKTIKVLLVEDNPGDIRLIREMLAEARGEAFELECAGRLSTGLERLAAGDIDVVLLDLSLPDSQGAETFAKAYTQTPQVPIIVLTGLGDEALAVEEVREGAQDYLIKGQVDGNLLVRAMRYAIERKRSEEALRESEARYRTVSELTSDFAYAVRLEPDGTLVLEWVTEAFTRITGFTPDEAQALGGWESLIHLDDRPIALRHLRVHPPDQPDMSEYRIVTKSGEVRWLRDYGRPVWDEAQGRVVRIYGAAQDITERKQMEQCVLRTERLAAMGHMAAALAHEIKNPLQAIRGHLELVLDFDLEPDEREEYLRFCCQEIDHLAEIAERALSFARPAGSTPCPASIAHLMQRALALVSSPLQQARVQVTTDLPTDLPPVLVVPDQIAQVLLNLMINAIEAMPDGGHAHIVARVEGDIMVLTLTNDGPPIPAEHMAHIFEPFFTTKPDGTGLGLFISHNIIEQHGGTIGVENLRDDQGVTFTITLPLAHSVEGQEVVEGPAPSFAEGSKEPCSE